MDEGVRVTSRVNAALTWERVWGNVVAHSLLTGNGTMPRTPGAGVVIATQVPGATVSGNTVADNRIYGNGNAGVTIHSHLKERHLTGNRIIGNWIGRNNSVGDTIDPGAPPPPGRPV